MMRLSFYVTLLSVSLLALFSCGEGGSVAGGTKAKTASGFEYEITKKAGNPTIQPGQYAYFNFVQRLDDSTLNTSADMGKQPKIMIPNPDQVQGQPNPINELLAIMGKGDEATVYVPIDSLRGAGIPPSFLKYKHLIYDIVMDEIKTAEEFQAEAEAEKAAAQAKTKEVETFANTVLGDYKAGKLDGVMVTSPTGLKYVVHEQGSGPKKAAGENVNVNYYGMLTDGTRFDDSFSRGQLFSFPLGQGRVIPGWDEGISYLSKGGKATFFIPSNLGYGERGSPPTIPPNAELVFYVEVE